MLITPQLNPRYWSQRIILDFLFSFGTSWPRSHCFEAWINKWSTEVFDNPRLDSWSLDSPFSKTSFTAFSASTSLTPFLKSAWSNNNAHIKKYISPKNNIKKMKAISPILYLYRFSCNLSSNFLLLDTTHKYHIILEGYKIKTIFQLKLMIRKQKILG